MLSAPATDAALSGECRDLLVALGGAVHKQRAYPASHPLRLAAQQRAFDLLTSALAVDPSFRLGVARRQLMVGDRVSERGHLILEDLASALWRRQVGSITFHRGIDRGTFTAFLERLTAGGTNGVQEPLDPETINLPNIEVHGIAFGALSLGRSDAPDSPDSTAIWRRLAADMEEAGQALLQGHGGQDADHQLRAALTQLGAVVRKADGDGTEAVEQGLRGLVSGLPPDLIDLILTIDVGQREVEESAVVDLLPASALLELLGGAARARSRDLSGVLLRLLQKLARKGGKSGPGASSVPDIRRVVHTLIGDWTLDDPNSRSHQHVLDSLARFETGVDSGQALGGESLRLVQMALELGTINSELLTAVDHTVQRDALAALVAALDEAGSGPVVEAVWRHLLSPALLPRMLGDPAADDASLLAVVARAGAEEIPLLADLVLAPKRPGVQLAIVSRLCALGADGAAALARRIEAAGADHCSRLLALVGELPVVPDWLDLSALLEHRDPLVRREALRLAIRCPEPAEAVLHRALADEDDGVVRIVLEEGGHLLPRSAVPRLILLAGSRHRPPPLKALAVEVLKGFDDVAVREWLLRNLLIRRWWWVPWRGIAPKDPVVIARLRALASRWAGHPSVDRVLAAARRSTDPEIRAAVSVRGTP